jgi:hypothetical protein
MIDRLIVNPIPSPLARVLNRNVRVFSVAGRADNQFAPAGIGRTQRLDGVAGMRDRSPRLASCRRLRVSGPPVERHVAGLRLDSFQPGADARIGSKVEAAFIGNVGVGVERDIGDGVRRARQPIAPG